MMVLAVAVAICTTAAKGKPAAKSFRDCASCPEMSIVPPGKFLMGSSASEKGRFEDEGPAHLVTIRRSFAVMQTPVTVAEFTRFARETGFQSSEPCNHWNATGEWEASPALNWRNPGFDQSPTNPVVCVSWRDGRRYAQWLSAKAGHRYRFLTESEFEYAARAKSVTIYPWGNGGDVFCHYANGFDRSAGRLHPDWGEQPCDDGYAFTSPVGQYPANPFGLVDMTGNVFQWVQDCFLEGGYRDAPTTGLAVEQSPCKLRVIRGGSWANGPRGLRAAMRDRDPEDSRYSNIGIRLARDFK